MRINLKIDFNLLSEIVLREQMEKLGVRYKICKAGEIIIEDDVEDETRERLISALNKYGIEVLDDKQSVIVERIKNAIDTMLRNDKERITKASQFLADELNYSYSYLSTLFSEATFTSIENFIILRKVDLAKDLIANNDLTLTEIAYRLNYSSVAHLSAQFKKTTGLTPTTFQRILSKRRERIAGQS
jgi:AraC-like DNA-binding protein